MTTASTLVTVAVEAGGHLQSVDVDGGYYVLQDAEPRDQEGPTVPISAGRHLNVVRREGRSLVVVVDGVDYPLSGPIGCE
jgi:hypothetical protein